MVVPKCDFAEVRFSRITDDPKSVIPRSEEVKEAPNKGKFKKIL